VFSNSRRSSQPLPGLGSREAALADADFADHRVSQRVSLCGIRRAGGLRGTPNSDKTRFPDFLSVDARVLKDFKVNPKYTLRFSVSVFNLTNHFNALSVHSNIADPQVGTFFGDYKRRFQADFDVVF